MRATWLFLLLLEPGIARAQPASENEPAPPPATIAAPPLKVAAPVSPLAPSADFGRRYLLEGIEIRGNYKTETEIIAKEIGLSVGDAVAATDPRVEAARLRLLSLGYFLDVQFSLEKGAHRGGAILVVTVEERGTIVINALHLGTSEATALWGGLDVAETNFLGRGIGIGGGFVASTTPKVPGAFAARAFSLRVVGPGRGELHLTPFGSFLRSDGSEFFRARGRDDEATPSAFAAIHTRRSGGTLGISSDLSRATRVSIEGRYELIEATLPATRTRALPDGTLAPIDFAIHEGDSRLASVVLGLDIDTRSDPVLPSSGGRASVTLHTALPLFGSRYAFAKGVAQGSWYHPLRHHVLGIHGFAGAVFGDAPYFEQFFVGDMNLLLPPRALGLNFSTLSSRDFLGTSVAAHRYDAYAARLLVEYAIPLWRRHGFVYRGDAFAAFGAFAMASGDDLRVRDVGPGQAIPADLTADLGIRLDTYIGIFTLSVANALGRIPF